MEENNAVSDTVTPAGTEFHNDDTLFKVYNALTSRGLTKKWAREAITALQNEGILFRERVK
jgi:hypothetical protein